MREAILVLLSVFRTPYFYACIYSFFFLFFFASYLVRALPWYGTLVFLAISFSTSFFLVVIKLIYFITIIIIIIIIDDFIIIIVTVF